MKTTVKIKEPAVGMTVLATKSKCINCYLISKGDTGTIGKVLNKNEFSFRDQYGCTITGCVQCCKEVKGV